MPAGACSRGGGRYTALPLPLALLPLHASALGGLDASRRLPVPPPLLLPLEHTLPHRLVTRRGPPFLLAA